MIEQHRFSMRPLYLQVRDSLAAEISGGSWKPSAMIPNEIDLSRKLGVSVGTVRRALDVMEKEHLLTRRQGRGTFVNDPATSQASTRFVRICDGAGQAITDSATTLSIETGDAGETEAHRLGIVAGEAVKRVRRLRRIDGTPYMMEICVIPMHRFQAFALDDSFPHSITAVAQACGVLLGSAQETIGLAAADLDLSQHLDVEAGQVVLKLDRVVRDIDATPVEWRTAFCQLGSMHYRVDIS